MGSIALHTICKAVLAFLKKTDLDVSHGLALLIKYIATVTQDGVTRAFRAYKKPVIHVLSNLVQSWEDGVASYSIVADVPPASFSWSKLVAEEATTAGPSQPLRQTAENIQFNHSLGYAMQYLQFFKVENAQGPMPLPKLSWDQVRDDLKHPSMHIPRVRHDTATTAFSREVYGPGATYLCCVVCAAQTRFNDTHTLEVSDDMCKTFHRVLDRSGITSKYIAKLPNDLVLKYNVKSFHGSLDGLLLAPAGCHKTPMPEHNNNSIRNVSLCDKCYTSIYRRGQCPKFAIANGLAFEMLPKEFDHLTNIERQMCALVTVRGYLQVYSKSLFRARTVTSHLTLMKQDGPKIAQMLPRSLDSNDVNIQVTFSAIAREAIRTSIAKGVPVPELNWLLVNTDRVRAFVEYLMAHNPYYKDAAPEIDFHELENRGNLDGFNVLDKLPRSLMHFVDGDTSSSLDKSVNSHIEGHLRHHRSDGQGTVNSSRDNDGSSVAAASAAAAAADNDDNDDDDVGKAQGSGISQQVVVLSVADTPNENDFSHGAASEPDDPRKYVINTTREFFPDSDKRVHVLALPDLFPRGHGALSEERPFTLNRLEYVLHCLDLYSGQFANHPLFLALEFDRLSRSKAKQKAFITASVASTNIGNDFVIPPEKFRAALEWWERDRDNAKACRRREPEPTDPSTVKALKLIRSAKYAAGSMYNTEQERTGYRKDAESLTNAFGAPNVFVTINPFIDASVHACFAAEGADVHSFHPDNVQCPMCHNFVQSDGKTATHEWFELYNGSTYPNYKRREAALSNNPSASERWFHTFLQAFLRHIVGVDPENGQVYGGCFGIVVAYAGCIEGQQRSMLHAHLLLHVAGLPRTPTELQSYFSESSENLAKFQSCMDSFAWQNYALDPEHVICPKVNSDDQDTSVDNETEPHVLSSTVDEPMSNVLRSNLARYKAENVPHSVECSCGEHLHADDLALASATKILFGFAQELFSTTGALPPVCPSDAYMSNTLGYFGFESDFPAEVSKSLLRSCVSVCGIYLASVPGLYTNTGTGGLSPAQVFATLSVDNFLQLTKKLDHHMLADLSALHYNNHATLMSLIPDPGDTSAPGIPNGFDDAHATITNLQRLAQAFITILQHRNASHKMVHTPSCFKSTFQQQRAQSQHGILSCRFGFPKVLASGSQLIFSDSGGVEYVPEKNMYSLWLTPNFPNIMLSVSSNMDAKQLAACGTAQQAYISKYPYKSETMSQTTTQSIAASFVRNQERLPNVVNKSHSQIMALTMACSKGIETALPLAATYLRKGTCFVSSHERIYYSRRDIAIFMADEDLKGCLLTSRAQDGVKLPYHKLLDYHSRGEILDIVPFYVFISFYEVRVHDVTTEFNSGIGLLPKFEDMIDYDILGNLLCSLAFPPSDDFNNLANIPFRIRYAQDSPYDQNWPERSAMFRDRPVVPCPIAGQSFVPSIRRLLPVNFSLFTDGTFEGVLADTNVAKHPDFHNTQTCFLSGTDLNTCSPEAKLYLSNINIALLFMPIQDREYCASQHLFISVAHRCSKDLRFELPDFITSDVLNGITKDKLGVKVTHSYWPFFVARYLASQMMKRFNMDVDSSRTVLSRCLKIYYVVIAQCPSSLITSEFLDEQVGNAFARLPTDLEEYLLKNITSREDSRAISHEFANEQKLKAQAIAKSLHLSHNNHPTDPSEDTCEEAENEVVDDDPNDAVMMQVEQIVNSVAEEEENAISLSLDDPMHTEAFANHATAIATDFNATTHSHHRRTLGTEPTPPLDPTSTTVSTLPATIASVMRTRGISFADSYDQLKKEYKARKARGPSSDLSPGNGVDNIPNATHLSQVSPLELYTKVYHSLLYSETEGYTEKLKNLDSIPRIDSLPPYPSLIEVAMNVFPNSVKRQALNAQQFNAFRTLALYLIKECVLTHVSDPQVVARLLAQNDEFSVLLSIPALFANTHCKLDEGSLFALITGGAGSGKSAVIKALGLFCEKWGITYALEVTATTGVAAVLLGGNTYHSILGFNSFREGSRQSLTEEENARLASIKMIIIDEYSFVSCSDLQKIIARLDEVKGHRRAALVCVGDPCQLFVSKPPLHQPLYGPDSAAPAAGYSAAAYAGSSFYRNQISHVFQLDVNFRQNSDPHLATILDSFRDATLRDKPDLVEALNSRVGKPGKGALPDESRLSFSLQCGTSIMDSRSEMYERWKQLSADYRDVLKNNDCTDIPPLSIDTLSPILLKVKGTLDPDMASDATVGQTLWSSRVLYLNMAQVEVYYVDGHGETVQNSLEHKSVIFACIDEPLDFVYGHNNEVYDIVWRLIDGTTSSSPSASLQCCRAVSLDAIRADNMVPDSVHLHPSTKILVLRDDVHPPTIRVRSPLSFTKPITTVAHESRHKYNMVGVALTAHDRWKDYTSAEDGSPQKERLYEQLLVKLDSDITIFRKQARKDNRGAHSVPHDDPRAISLATRLIFQTGVSGGGSAKRDTNRLSSSPTLYLGVGMPVWISYNICVPAGIANGSLGVVIGFIWPNFCDTRSATTLSSTVILGARVPVLVPTAGAPLYVLVRLIQEEAIKANSRYPIEGLPPGVAAISTQKYGISSFRTNAVKNYKCLYSQVQFPIEIAFGSTGHKIQGMSLQNGICVGTWKGATPTWMYVVLSRAKRLLDIDLLEPLDISKVNNWTVDTDLNAELKRQHDYSEFTRRLIQHIGAISRRHEFRSMVARMPVEVVYQFIAQDPNLPRLAAEPSALVKRCGMAPVPGVTIDKPEVANVDDVNRTTRSTSRYTPATVSTVTNLSQHRRLDRGSHEGVDTAPSAVSGRKRRRAPTNTVGRVDIARRSRARRNLSWT